MRSIHKQVLQMYNRLIDNTEIVLKRRKVIRGRQYEYLFLQLLVNH